MTNHDFIITPGKWRRFASFFIAIVALYWCLPVMADDIPVRTIEIPSSPDVLPYRFEPVWQYALDCRFRWIGCTDLNNNGADEPIYIYGRDESSGGYTSAVVVEDDRLGHRALDQINSRYSQWPIADAFLTDIWGDSVKELLLVRAIEDSVYLEVNVFSDSSAPETIYVLAAVARWGLAAKGWKDLFIIPLAGVDLNGDSRRDLLFSRSSKVNNAEKADSAFERGLVAYDLAGDSVLWFFHLADVVGGGDILVLDRPDGGKLIVVAVNACGNRYSVNGMDSEHAYLVAANARGREVWRRVISEGSIFYPHMMAYDADANDMPEIYLDLTEHSSGNKDITTLVGIDPLTGKIVKRASPITLIERDPFILSDSAGHGATILMNCMDKAGGRIYQYTLDLNLAAIWEGRFANINIVHDLVGGSFPEIIVGSLSREAVMLDRQFRPIGLIPDEGVIDVYHGYGTAGILSNSRRQALIMIPRKTPVLTMYFARYKWWLAVGAAVALFFGILRLVIWVRRLYQSSLGLPTLDHINAAVIVLDRKRRVMFSNKNPLVHRLFGNNLRRSKTIEKSAMTRYPELIAAARQSFREPLLPYTERLELPVSDRIYQVELVVYPRVEKGKTFLGKILVIEDISGKIAWERKAVLGEAAQRWVHKLKNSIATASISLGNMAEDGRVLAGLSDEAAFRQYCSEIKGQLGAMTGTADKILRYARITKPNLVMCNLNQVVQEAMTPYCRPASTGITVAKKLQPNLPEALIDPDQIKEVVDNLLSNAMKAVKDGGQVTIETQLASGLHDAVSDGRVAEIVITDTGCGIPQDELDRIFLPGYSRRGNSTGIGLAVVREIIANHGGKIEVKSIEGQGSQFLIRLPLTEGARHE